MILLGIETATQVCGAALTQDGRLLCEYRANLKNRHAAVLAPAIETILRDAQISAAQLGGIAVSIGPGSFTGLRIGLATAKGIAFATGCPIAAVPTLEALAAQAPAGETLICPVVRSRGDQVYAAIYRRGEDRLTMVQEPAVYELAVISTWLPAGACLIGELESYMAKYPALSGLKRAPAESGLLSACTIARLGGEQIERNLVEEIESLEPRYLQDFIAGKPRAAVFAPGLHER